MQDQEIEALKKRVNARQIKGRRGTRARRKLGIDGFGNLEEDKEELTRLTQERAERKRAQVTRAAKRSVKKKIRDDVASGKRGAYYPKRNELRKMEVEARFEEIRKRGGDEAVDKAIAKRRKKNVAKSHKLMPTHKV
jgi:ribosomal RNA-processing protein 36